jgi:predicted Na+-dependent transporter
MVGDVLIAVVIIVIAALLGILVHPLLWLVLIVAALWLFSRRASWSRA